jgi:hypothetical protein
MYVLVTHDLCCDILLEDASAHHRLLLIYALYIFGFGTYRYIGLNSKNYLLGTLQYRGQNLNPRMQFNTIDRDQRLLIRISS